MELFAVILQVITVILLITSIFVYERMAKQHREELKKSRGVFAEELRELREKLDNVQVKEIVVGSPNTVTKTDDETIPLSENMPWAIPPDVKIEVEGGDMLAPAGYEAT